jgi:hypothetical protein
MLYLCEDFGVASCSSHILCSYNFTLGSISSVYPDSVNGQRHSTDCSSSSFRPIPSSFVTSLHSGMILDNKVPTPSHRPYISRPYEPCHKLSNLVSQLHEARTLHTINLLVSLQAHRWYKLANFADDWGAWACPWGLHGYQRRCR